MSATIVVVALDVVAGRSRRAVKKATLNPA
jgi:hypothetical protein